MTLAEKKAAYKLAWARANAEKMRSYRRAWEERNPDKKAAELRRYRATQAGKASRARAAKKYKLLHPDRVKEQVASWHAKNPDKSLAIRQRTQRKNRGYRNAQEAARRASKIHATPSWVDKTALNAVYLEAKRRSLTVDHIVPLRGKLVCGLHVPWNLQLLTLSENSRKKNQHAG